MPSVESFKKEQTKRPMKAQPKKKTAAAKVKVAAAGKAAAPAPAAGTARTSEAKARPKRRPALEGATISDENEKISVVDMEAKMNAEEHSNDDSPKADDPKFQFAFPGSELLRARFPKSLSFTETVVDEWAKDGTFENLPIEHPIVALMAQKGLRQAKEAEQKLFANPVVERAMVQAITVGFKVQNAWVDAKKRWKKG